MEIKIKKESYKEHILLNKLRFHKKLVLNVRCYFYPQPHSEESPLVRIYLCGLQ